MHKGISKEIRYPFQDRPFENKESLPEGFFSVNNNYFLTFRNLINLFEDFLSKDERQSNLFINNLNILKSKLEDMQIYFDQIILSNEINAEGYSSKCKNEKEVINNFVNCCYYYQNKKPNIYFNKNDVKIWVSKKQAYKHRSAKNSLIDLSSKFDVTFPKKDIDDKNLTYYPVIISGVTPKDSFELLNIIYGSINFLSTEYDYLLLLFNSEGNSLFKTGFKVTRKLLENTRNELMNMDINNDDESNILFPIEVTQKILDCFSDQYNIINNEDKNAGDIFEICESLWAISVSRDNIIPKDNQYMNMIVEEYKTTIDEKLSRIVNDTNNDILEDITQIYNRVCEGDKFTTKEFNQFINCNL